MKVNIEEILGLNIHHETVFGKTISIDIRDGFVIKESRLDSMEKHFFEAQWILFGDNNLRSLLLTGVDWWNDIAYKYYVGNVDLQNSLSRKQKEVLTKEFYIDNILQHPEFALEYGDMGRVYGEQLRNWGDYASTSGSLVPPEEGATRCNQVEFVIKNLKRKSKLEQLVFYMSNPSDINNSSLYPGQTLMQFSIIDGYLDCCVYNRYCDLDNDFEIVFPRSQYILSMLAVKADLTPRMVHFQGGLFTRQSKRSMNYQRIKI